MILGVVLHGIKRPRHIGCGSPAVHRLVVGGAKMAERGIKISIAPRHVRSPLSRNH